MNILQFIRNWWYARKIKKIYIEQLSIHSGIPIDRLKGIEVGIIYDTEVTIE